MPVKRRWKKIQGVSNSHRMCTHAGRQAHFATITTFESARLFFCNKVGLIPCRTLHKPWIGASRCTDNCIWLWNKCSSFQPDPFYCCFRNPRNLNFTETNCQGTNRLHVRLVCTHELLCLGTWNNVRLVIRDLNSCFPEFFQMGFSLLCTPSMPFFGVNLEWMIRKISLFCNHYTLDPNIIMTILLLLAIFITSICGLNFTFHFKYSVYTMKCSLSHFALPIQCKETESF